MKPKPSTTQKTGGNSHSQEKEPFSQDFTCGWVTDGIVCLQTHRSSKELDHHLKTVHVPEANKKCSWKDCGRNTQAYSTIQGLRDHLSTHTGEKPYNCPDCGKTFSRSGLAKHRTKAHPDKKKQKAPKEGNSCLWCKNGIRCTFVGENAANLTSHIRSIHNADVANKMCFWMGCLHHLPFSEQAFCVAHIRRHYDDRPFGCRYCPSSYVLAKDLNDHETRKHPEEKKRDEEQSSPHSYCYWIEEDETGCAFAGVNPLDLTRHVSVEHIQESGGFVCQWSGCGKSFSSKKDFIKHFRGVHNEEDKPYSCPACAKEFSLKKELDDHMRSTHQGEATEFKCYWMSRFKTCGHACRNSTELPKHIKKDHKEDFEKFLCNWGECWMVFQDKLAYLDHVASHTLGRSFECEFCHETFTHIGITQHRKRCLRDDFDLVLQSVEKAQDTTGDQRVQKTAHTTEERRKNAEMKFDQNDCDQELEPLDHNHDEACEYTMYPSKSSAKKQTKKRLRKSHREATPQIVCCWMRDDDLQCAHHCRNFKELRGHIEEMHEEAFQNFKCRWSRLGVCPVEVKQRKDFVAHLGFHVKEQATRNRTTDLARHYNPVNPDDEHRTKKRGRQSIDPEDDQGPAKRHQNDFENAQAPPATDPTSFSMDQHQMPSSANYSYTPQEDAYLDDYTPYQQPTSSSGFQDQDYEMYHVHPDAGQYGDYEDPQWQQAPGDHQPNEPVYMDIGNIPGSSNEVDDSPQNGFGFGYDRL